MSDGVAKVRMTLPQTTIGSIDRLAVDIRLHRSVTLSRGEIITALIEAALRSGVDLSQASTMETIRDLLATGPWRR